ncbi:cytochrome c-type biogenesis protein CcmH/NrfF [Planomonospora venezuelensis]|uniref:Cytochrome c-type biogenesis protein CcmH/NrfF n=1 Tax=Planomonospora venezuelensis TaxID=1999 RepID=A0A841DA56_PLAVE|nr:cytochrome c-type biogenesis protein CcmH/NrfF [Planomonospora venezuelensis]
MYKDFAIEAVMWLIPVVVLIALAWMITATA